MSKLFVMDGETMLEGLNQIKVRPPQKRVEPISVRLKAEAWRHTEDPKSTQAALMYEAARIIEELVRAAVADAKYHGKQSKRLTAAIEAAEGFL